MPFQIYWQLLHRYIGQMATEAPLTHPWAVTRHWRCPAYENFARRVETDDYSL